ATDFARAVEARRDDSHFWLCHAFAKLALQDVDGFRQVSTAMREQFGMSTDPYIANRLVLVFVATAETRADAGELVRWAQVAQRDPRHRRVLGQALYRDGQYKAAVDHFQELAGTTPLSVTEELFLAMTHHRVGNKDKAAVPFATAVKMID